MAEHCGEGSARVTEGRASLCHLTVVPEATCPYHTVAYLQIAINIQIDSEMNGTNGILPDVRVHDYLDDRLQTSADLELLDSLLEDVKSQQTLLRQQLDEAKRDHAKALTKAQDASRDLENKQDASHRQQQEAESSLIDFTQASSFQDATARFQNITNALHRLDVANAYVELGTEAETLRYARILTMCVALSVINLC